jgi:hypothetical protein
MIPSSPEAEIAACRAAVALFGAPLSSASTGPFATTHLISFDCFSKAHCRSGIIFNFPMQAVG